MNDRSTGQFLRFSSTDIMVLVCLAIGIATFMQARENRLARETNPQRITTRFNDSLGENHEVTTPKVPDESTDTWLKRHKYQLDTAKKVFN